jgi:hypothetical protein
MRIAEARLRCCRPCPRKVSWQRCRVSLWYGRSNRLVEIASGTAIWYHSGAPPVPIRWLLVRDPTGELEAQAFLATDLNPRHRPQCSPRRHSRMVRQQVAGRGDICRSSRSPRRRNPAPVVGQSNPSYHAGSARLVLNRHSVGTRSFQITKAQAENGRMVSKGGVDLLWPGRLIELDRSGNDVRQEDFWRILGCAQSNSG